MTNLILAYLIGAATIKPLLHIEMLISNGMLKNTIGLKWEQFTDWFQGEQDINHLSN